jgi:hypothetical protein
VHQGQFEDLTVRLDDDQFQVVVIAVVTTDSAPFLLEGHSMPHQELDHVVRDVTEQVQGDPGLGIGSAFENRPDQLGPKAGEEGHGFERSFAQLPDRGSMLIAAIEGLVAPQFGLDFAVRRKPGMRRNAEAMRGFFLGAEVVSLTFGGENARRFEGDFLSTAVGGSAAASAVA